MDCYHFNTFANIYKEKNYKINSNSERFTDDMDIDKFEQLRMDYTMRQEGNSSFASPNCFAAYIWQASRFMEDSGLYLCDRDGTPLSSAEIDGFICEECEADAATLGRETDDRVLCACCRRDGPLPYCLGCVEDQPNQLAHMGHGGCLEITDDDDDISEPLTGQDLYEAAPDSLVVSSDEIDCDLFGTYIKTERNVRGAPLYIKTNPQDTTGEIFILFRGDAGQWIFSDDEENIESSIGAMMSISTTAQLPCEPGIQFEMPSDDGDDDNNVDWVTEPSVVVRAG
jgi:hypothetical protein